jgi:uncharacterized delta-60 repeat protein
MSKLGNDRKKAKTFSKRAALDAAVGFAVEPLETRRLLSASIAGTVYNDANGNHLRDAAEVGAAGMKVYLDLNGIDTLVAGDPVATTDATGHYSFTNLAAGNYLVRPVPVAGTVTTTPIWGGKYFVQLTANQNVAGDDFGVQSAGSPNFVVGGQLLIAGSSNGVATLSRYNADGSADVPFGTLGLLTLPSAVTGQPTTATSQGGNLVVTYPSLTVTISPNSTVTTSPTVGGPALINAPSGLGIVALSPTAVQINFTDNSTNEDHFVIERSTAPTGPFASVGQTNPGSGPSTGTTGFTDNTAQPSTTYYYRVYAAAGSSTSAIAGPMSITTPAITTGTGPGVSGTVYLDSNGNHQRDAGETGVAGVQVYLDLQGIDSFVAGDPVSTTDASGAYSFTGLASGNYLVRLVPQARQVTTSPIWGGKYFLQYSANQNVTGEDFGVQSLPGTSYLTINNQTLVLGTANGQATVTRYNADESLDISFGTLGTVTLPPSVSGAALSGYAQGTNTVISYTSATVTLNNTGGIVSITGAAPSLNAPTNLTATATSPTSVQISFTDNSTNDQGFVIERSTSASGPWAGVLTLPGSTYGASTGAVVVSDNSVAQSTIYYYRVYAVNGSQQSAVAGPMSVTTPAIVSSGGSISGMVYQDDNLDGVLGTYERPLKGQQIYLDLPGIGHYVSGDPIATTDDQGKYSFTGLVAGNYLVRPVTAPDLVISQPLWGGKYFVQLANNQVVSGEDFGTRSASFNWTSSVTRPDGKLLVASSTGTLGTAAQAAISRFNADRSVDTTFGVLGKERIDTITSLSLPSTSTTILAVRSDDFVVVGTIASVTTSGSGGSTTTNYEYINLVDPSGRTVRSDLFGSYDFYGGVAPLSATFLPTGKILVAGDHAFDRSQGSHRPLVLKRYNSDLTPDLTFGTNGLLELNHLEGFGATVTGLADGSMQVHYSNDTVNLSNTGAIDPARLIPAPTGLVATGSSPGPLQFQFSDNSTNEQSFVVQRIAWNSDFADWTNFATVTGSTDTGLRTFADNNLNPSYVYGYRVYAVNGGVYSDTVGPVTTVKIRGTVFDDVNQNGLQDAGEPGIPNMHVFDPANPAVSTYTNANGYYEINNAPGIVHLRTGPLASGRIFTSPVSGSYDFSLPSTSSGAGIVIGLNTAAGPSAHSIGGAGTLSLNDGPITHDSVLTIVGIPYTSSITANFATSVPTTIPHVTLPNGQIVVAHVANGYTPSYPLNPVQASFSLTRYNTDGTADTSFGTNGVLTVNNVNFPDKIQVGALQAGADGSVALLIQQAGPPFVSLVLTVYPSLWIVNPAGQVRSSSPLFIANFSRTPLMAFAPDGKLILAGNAVTGSGIMFGPASVPNSLVVERFNSDLTPDSGFGSSGQAVLQNVIGVPTAVAGLADGSVVVTYANDSVHLMPSGALDPARVLPAPTNLTLNALSPTQVSVQFTDNSTSEQFFNIESATSAGNWNFVLEGTVAGSASMGVRQFLVTDAKPGVYTQYRVRAVNGTVESNPSAVAVATTPLT